MIFEIPEYLLWSVLALVMASVASAVIGPFVVVKKLGHAAGGISHAVLAGVGAALYFNFSPFLGIIIAAVTAAMIVAWIRSNHSKTSDDTLISALWAMGMAIGLLFLFKAPRFSVELHSFLFGNLLLIPKKELLAMGLLDLLLLLGFLPLFRVYTCMAFDEEYCRLRKLPSTLMHYFFYLTLALTVVLLVRSVGLILVIAVLALPAAIVAPHSRSLKQMAVASFGLSLSLSLMGLWLAYLYDLPAAASIVFLISASFFIARAVGRALVKGRRAS